MTARLAVRAERAFDGERWIRDGALVLAENGRIVAVEPATAPVPSGWQVVEHPGSTLLPGLIDAHVHLSGDGESGALDRLADYRDAELDSVVETSLRAQLAAGVTTVRDLGCRRFAVLGWRNRPGLPAVVASGPPITVAGGHCANMGGGVSGTAQLRAAVEERVERGADVVKIMASGGVMTAGTDPFQPQFSLDELRLVVDQAHAAGLPVTAHAHALAAVELAVAAGVDGIEHCTCGSRDGFRLPAGLLNSLAALRIAVCPTLGGVRVPSPPPHLLEFLRGVGLLPEQERHRVARFVEGGVRLVSGSDAGIGEFKPHGVLPTSIIALAEAGAGLDAALASATAVAADVCGLGRSKGRLRAGFDADLLLVDGDPSGDLTALTRPAAVVLAGQRVSGHAGSAAQDAGVLTGSTTAHARD
ncbi:amidohydrolase family protein [Lentzea rhizosphaerae]|uniref:Amidohydrolase family protein n=1 Tax=Lentzea rhizosphaerae TaxID=2041025 RepID=A0ABV8BSS7_9PSEU